MSRPLAVWEGVEDTFVRDLEIRVSNEIPWHVRVVTPYKTLGSFPSLLFPFPARPKIKVGKSYDHSLSPNSSFHS